MPKPRSYQVSLIDTPYYHCVSRCVRRAWVEDKVLWLSSVFAIGICAYAVMSNHVHLVLCVDKDKAMSWSDKQVVGRWHRLHRGTLLSQKFIRNELLSESEWISLKETIVIYRQRLYDINLWVRDADISNRERPLMAHLRRSANGSNERSAAVGHIRYLIELSL
ncbi:MAG: REP element-mobilizing transposase RayT [Francisellaceae bacterium]|jgi:REP element-mobilizing transposase RayT